MWRRSSDPRDDRSSAQFGRAQCRHDASRFPRDDADDGGPSLITVLFNAYNVRPRFDLPADDRRRPGHYAVHVHARARGLGVNGQYTLKRRCFSAALLQINAARRKLLYQRALHSGPLRSGGNRRRGRRLGGACSTTRDGRRRRYHYFGAAVGFARGRGQVTGSRRRGSVNKRCFAGSGDKGLRLHGCVIQRQHGFRSPTRGHPDHRSERRGGSSEQDAAMRLRNSAEANKATYPRRR